MLQQTLPLPSRLQLSLIANKSIHQRQKKLDLPTLLMTTMNKERKKRIKFQDPTRNTFVAEEQLMTNRKYNQKFNKKYNFKKYSCTEE